MLPMNDALKTHMVAERIRNRPAEFKNFGHALTLFDGTRLRRPSLCQQILRH